MTGNIDGFKKRLPPYVSYRTFRNFLEDLQQGGIPARVDRSYWGDRFSGSTGTQLVATLRFLRLTDNEGMPTGRLRQLVSAKGPQRTDIMKQITYESFDFYFKGSIDLQTATPSQLEDLLHNTYQITGDVARKCIKFFVELATEAEIPLSKFVIKKSGTARASTGTRKTVKKKTSRTDKNLPMPLPVREIPNGRIADDLLLSKFPNFDPGWPDDLKVKWFDAFDQLLKRISASASGK
jgi:hypothetical protein